MLIISSSAKTLDFESPYKALVVPTEPEFMKEAVKVHKELADLSMPKLKKLLGVNEKLAILNFERMKVWSRKHSDENASGNARPSIFAYKGDVFRQLTPTEYSEKECEYAARSVYVMSGLYGAVGAFDFIQPYRLEMAAEVGGIEDGVMSDFWRDKITNYFNELIEKEGHRFMLDLASKEYSAAVDFEKLACPTVKVDFKEKKNGKLKIMGIFSKRARGMMIDFCIRNQIEQVQDITKFKGGGYEFMGEEDGKYVFVR